MNLFFIVLSQGEPCLVDGSSGDRVRILSFYIPHSAFLTLVHLCKNPLIGRQTDRHTRWILPLRWAFPTMIKLFKSHVLSILLYGCESWTLTTLKTTCTGGCLAYRTENKKPNEYIWQQVDILAGRHELLLSTVASYHGSATSVIVMRCRILYYKKQWMAVVTEEDFVDHWRSTSRNGQASRCRHCCGDICPSTPNDAWVSRVLVS